jgi:hypothetical protein
MILEIRFLLECVFLLLMMIEHVSRFWKNFSSSVNTMVCIFIFQWFLIFYVINLNHRVFSKVLRYVYLCIYVRLDYRLLSSHCLYESIRLVLNFLWYCLGLTKLYLIDNIVKITFCSNSLSYVEDIGLPCITSNTAAVKFNKFHLIVVTVYSLDCMRYLWYILATQ